MSDKPIIFLKHKGKSQTKTDKQGNTTTDHWDGRKDVTIRPRRINLQAFPQGTREE